MTTNEKLDLWKKVQEHIEYTIQCGIDCGAITENMSREEKVRIAITFISDNDELSDNSEE